MKRGNVVAQVTGSLCSRFRWLFVLAAFLSICAPVVAGNALLMTLSVQDSTVEWQEEFVVSLEIYGAPSADPPLVTIDGMDQFKLHGQGKNLLQVPGGKTVKWILTYTLSGLQDGTFKLGPAKASVDGHTYSSNTIFIEVEGATAPKKKKSPEFEIPLVHSAREVQDKVIITMDAENLHPFRNEGFVITLRLLSQLPVENLKFTQEAEFPGLLKYDFPYTDRPQAAYVNRNNERYVAFDLQKFLVFPLREGIAVLPSYQCEVRVRVPSSSFIAADLVLDLTRNSNALKLDVKPLPAANALVGSFALRSEVVSDEPQTKTLRYILEGNGLLSTFAFPDPAGKNFTSRPSGAATDAEIKGIDLHSRRTAEFEILPAGSATDVVLPSMQVLQFDPRKQSISRLTLPEMKLRFSQGSGSETARRAPFPETRGVLVPAAIVFLLLTTGWVSYRLLRPGRRKKKLEFMPLFRRKNPELPISKTAALSLYQQIASRIGEREGSGETLMEILQGHLPSSDWPDVQEAVIRLEQTAFSTSRDADLTYGELKEVFQFVEKRWRA